MAPASRRSARRIHGSYGRDARRRQPNAVRAGRPNPGSERHWALGHSPPPLPPPRITHPFSSTLNRPDVLVDRHGCDRGHCHCPFWGPSQRSQPPRGDPQLRTLGTWHQLLRRVKRSRWVSTQRLSEGRLRQGRNSPRDPAAAIQFRSLGRTPQMRSNRSLLQGRWSQRAPG